MTTIILLAPLVGALICGFFWTLLGERLAQIISTGLLFLAAILSWYVFLTFDGVTQHITLLRWIESGSLSTDWGHPTGPADGDHAGGGHDGVGFGASVFFRLHGA